VLDGHRVMGYLWSYDVGVQKQIMRQMANTVDYVATRGYDPDATHRHQRAAPARQRHHRSSGTSGCSIPDGTLIPASARNAAFQRVLQYESRPDFNTDANALEVSLVRRQANAGRVASPTTLSKARDVSSADRAEGRVVDDLNPRL
jgi:hypothetical protein